MCYSNIINVLNMIKYFVQDSSIHVSTIKASTMLKMNDFLAIDASYLHKIPTIFKEFFVYYIFSNND